MTTRRDELEENHGCFTGDCPHQFQRDCMFAIYDAGHADGEASGRTKGIREVIDVLIEHHDACMEDYKANPQGGCTASGYGCSGAGYRSAAWLRERFGITDG